MAVADSGSSHIISFRYRRELAKHDPLERAWRSVGAFFPALYAFE